MTTSRILRRSRVTMLLAALGVLAASSCVDGPFAHANPNDAEFFGTMEIVATRDTITPRDPVTILKVVTDPVVVGYQPIWRVPLGSGVQHRVNGIFELSVAPTVTTSVQVTAIFQSRSITYTIHRAP
jgi:hypothetical protein